MKQCRRKTATPQGQSVLLLGANPAEKEVLLQARKLQDGCNVANQTNQGSSPGQY